MSGTNERESADGVVARVIGIDPGDRRIGVAVSDPLGWTAQGVTVIQRRGDTAAVLAEIGELVDRYEARLIVVGLPINMDGSHGPRAKLVDAFVADLRKVVAIPIETIDERLTTVEAEDALREAGLSRDKRKKRIDMVAAQLILQRYLDQDRSD